MSCIHALKSTAHDTGAAAGAADEQGRRLARVVPFLRSPDEETLFSHPVEGVVATVDVDTGEVLSVVDSGVVEQAEPGAARAAARRRALPGDVTFSATGTPGVSIDGSAVSWAGWSLRWRGNVRSGVELADVRFDDGNSPRRVLYEASLADLFVPYQDPDPAWAFRTLLDSAEFGMGNTLSSLQPGADCPASRSEEHTSELQSH